MHTAQRDEMPEIRVFANANYWGSVH